MARKMEKASQCPPKSWVPEGMDPGTAYLLKIKLHGHYSRENFTYKTEEVVDSNRTNFKDFIDDIREKYPWGVNEFITVNYHDPVNKNYPQVCSDQCMLEMFVKNATTKEISMLIQVHSNNEPIVLLPLPDWPTPEKIPNAADIHDVPYTPSLAVPSQATISQPSSSIQPVDKYLANPFKQNEHVGVDDEGIYSDDEIVVVTADGEREKERTDVLEVVSEEGEEEQDGVDEGEEEEDGVEDEGKEEEDWMVEDFIPIQNPEIVYDRNDPPMTKDSIYENIVQFRLAIAQHAIKHEFEYNIVKTDPGRFIAKCAAEGCLWRIHASTMQDNVTIQVKTNRVAHSCSSARRSEKIKPVSKAWVCEKVKDWLLEDATVGAKELQRRIHETHKVKVNYKRVYDGRELALEKLYGKWEDSFDRLYSYKAIIERESPGSFVVIDHRTVLGKLMFRRLLFALKPCIDGFLEGCRPYVAIDSTFLTSKFKGQLATMYAVDGHNWMYPVAFGVMDSETNDNWKWFMERLRDAIGNLDGLTICTDAGKGVDTAVHQVFPYAEHRECMLHLVNNFKKKFHGKVFDDNLWPAAYSYNPYFFQKHIERMSEAKSETVAYLKQNHVRLWTRSQFSGQCKVDYVANSLAECFNNWIKEHKGLHLVDFMDKIRHKLMVKWDRRRSISKKLEGNILPHIMKELNEKSRGLNHEVTRSDDTLPEVECKGGSGHRFVVNLRYQRLQH